jgi:hypothetical protein
MLVFVRAQEDFLLWIPVHPTRLHRHHVFALLRRDFVSASTPTRRSGLVRHGYPWVPTDQGPRGPYRVGPTCQKLSRLARNSVGLQVGLKTLSTVLVTLEELGRPYPDRG